MRSQIERSETDFRDFRSSGFLCFRILTPEDNTCQSSSAAEKRKKKLPLHLRLVKPTQAKRIARKSALKRKGKQARITKKAKKTTAKGRKMGLYKNR